MELQQGLYILSWNLEAIKMLSNLFQNTLKARLTLLNTQFYCRLRYGETNGVKCKRNVAVLEQLGEKQLEV